MRIRPAVLVLTLSVVGSPVAAQSLFNAAGIGVPTEALDGKARALGNLGIGLRGASFMPTDPAAVGRLVLSTGVMAGQPSWVDFTSDGGAGSFQGTRFPLLGVAYPVFRGMMSIQIGSFLDQQFQSENLGSIDLGSGPLETIDAFEQAGSVSTLNVGYARMLNPDVAVGLTVGRYAGSVVRTLTRTFGAGPTSGLDDYVERGKWSYSGIFVTAGVSIDLTSGITLAGSVQLPTDLHAKADELTSGADGSFDLPIQLRVGGSADLVPGLTVSASAARADWSNVARGLEGTTRAGDANGFGIGIEFSRARLLGKDAPLRFGFRRTGLPFAFEDPDAFERVFAGGFGLALNTTAGIVLGRADFAIERGRRTGAGIVENFWRATVSLIVSGF